MPLLLSVSEPKRVRRHKLEGNWYEKKNIKE